MGIKIHAGDFTSAELGMFGTITLKTKKTGWGMPGETMNLKDLASVEEASEESVKKVGGTVGWGVAGAVVLGPVGLLAGLLLGGRGKEITFVAQLKDGRKMLATTDSKTFTKLKASIF